MLCGLQCPLKHTLLCPEFEVKGSCGLGNKCKLHHPKKRKCQSQLTTNRLRAVNCNHLLIAVMLLAIKIFF